LCEKMMGNMLIRKATPEDAGKILAIYDYYVKETAITFEEETPSEAEFKARMQTIISRYPYFVAEEGGTVLGYAYASAFHVRSAYRWACEMSIYLDPSVRNHGLGRTLYDVLEQSLSKMGILNLYACISYPVKEDEYLTRNSVEFHSHMGYHQIGRFHRCGFKFGRWYDMVWMEKHIGKHGSSPREIIPFPEV